MSDKTATKKKDRGDFMSGLVSHMPFLWASDDPEFQKMVFRSVTEPDEAEEIEQLKAENDRLRREHEPDEAET